MEVKGFTSNSNRTIVSGLSLCTRRDRKECDMEAKKANRGVFCKGCREVIVTVENVKPRGKRKKPT